jgi:hypothetical protein
MSMSRIDTRAYRLGSYVAILQSGCIGKLMASMSSPVGGQYLVRWDGADGLTREAWFAETAIKRWRDQPTAGDQTDNQRGIHVEDEVRAR